MQQAAELIQFMKSNIATHSSKTVGAAADEPIVFAGDVNIKAGTPIYQSFSKRMKALDWNLRDGMCTALVCSGVIWCDLIDVIPPTRH